MEPTVSPAARLEAALDPISDDERAVIAAVVFHLDDVELGRLVRMVETARRDRWPS